MGKEGTSDWRNSLGKEIQVVSAEFLAGMHRNGKLPIGSGQDTVVLAKSEYSKKPFL